MKDSTLHIFNWLTELEELAAAKFVSECDIEYTWLDTLFGIGDNDREIEMSRATIYVPLKVYKTLSQYSETTGKIEEAIREFAESTSEYVNGIEWRAKLSNVVDLQNAKREETISKLLTEDYVNKQVRIMNQSLTDNPHLSLGTAKELIETCCKSILREEGIEYSKEWDIQRLVKETHKVINLTPFEVENPELVSTSIMKILSGLSNIVHGITELRNSYGSGHGHDPNFKMLDNMYVKLAVSSAGELAIFYLTLRKR